jgi:DNA-binding IclR family transcriptional regulator
MSVLSAEPKSPPAMPEPPASMVERMTLIMDAFAGPHTRLTLEDVTRRTNLPRSTAHRILDQLVRLEWLDRTPLGYGLGKRALGLGGKGGSNFEIREAAAPLLQNLYVRTGMVVHLAVLENSDVFYLDKIGGRFALAVPSRVAGRAPAHCTALGKAILAWLQPEQVELLIGTKINRLTNRSIGDISTLHQELNRIRQRRGLAFERGECFPHLSCVAAAIRGPEGPVASISLVGEIDTPLEQVAPLVANAARQASLALFPDLETRRRPLRPVPRAPDETWSLETMNRLLAVAQDGDWL